MGIPTPTWHPNGRELFFLSLPDSDGMRTMMAVGFAPGAPPRVGHPRPLFAERDLGVLWDIAPDGQRFFAVQTVKVFTPPVVTHIGLIPKWLEELKAKVPVPVR